MQGVEGQALTTYLLFLISSQVKHQVNYLVAEEEFQSRKSTCSNSCRKFPEFYSRRDKNCCLLGEMVQKLARIPVKSVLFKRFLDVSICLAS